MNKKSKIPNDSTIALNRKARHDYTIEKSYETGIVLQGWEIKSLRAGKAQIADSYVIVKNGEIWLLGALITPLTAASTHVVAVPTRTRKLLLNKKEIVTLIGHVERAGYTLIPLKMFWNNRNKIKLDIGLAKGKKKHDKRSDLKEQEWKRQQSRIFKKSI